MLSHANLVLPQVWLGDETASQDAAFFRAKNITFVVNATPDVPNSFQVQGVTYLRVPLNDPGPGQPPDQEDIAKMRAWLPEIVAAMRYHISRGETILVHCHAGIQRSAAIVAAYMLKYYQKTSGRQLSLRDVTRYLRSVRPQVFAFGWSTNFQKSLRN